jgi:CRISPR-associated protein Cmr4
METNMKLVNKLLFLYTESSLHAGTGSSVSAVDLPIQRERSTQYPLVQGSGVKGALRSQCNLSPDECKILFGPETKNGSDHAGAIAVGDAQIALFPVRSVSGVFAYVTCAHVLARIRRLDSSLPPLALTGEQKVLVTTPSAVTASGRVVLEEFSFTATPDDQATQIAQWFAESAFPDTEDYAYWREKVMNSLVILPDDDFRDFAVSSTEIVTRVRLDSVKKTVQQGALWTQETLPSDTLLFSAITARSPRGVEANDQRNANDIADLLMKGFNSRIQLGGDETTGQGVVALRWL